MAGTRWKSLLKRCLGDIHREFRIMLTPIPRPDKWVFVVGCYNSGTTLLAEVLGSHEKICGLPTEGHFLTDQLPSEHALGISRMWTQREDLFRLTENDKGPDVTRIKKEWNMRAKCSVNAMLEKSPQNGARMTWLQKNFENAYFIAMIRNGYAVAEGIHRKASPKSRMGRWPIQMCARQWSRSNEIIEADSARIDRFHWVRYEDFTANPEEVLGRILLFLELQHSSPMSLDKQWSIHERRQAIRNLNAESISRLSESDIREINTVAGPCLEHFGYSLIT